MKFSKEAILRELKSWGGLAIIFGGLYITGLHTEASALLQRVILATGLRNADTDGHVSGKADYSWKMLEWNTQKQIQLSDFKGKTVFINVWASWCPPCIAEMPSIQSLYDQLKNNEDVVFIMLNIDEDKEKANKFLKRKNYTFPIYERNSPTPEIFQSRSIPVTFVINKQGEIIYSHKGIANYDSQSFVNMLTSD
ncbi:TlpA disulfide reductase family protein [Flammeovirga sp. SubArs3]|uniref:TlpA family protein disulfide reductase n=1 Tax=Flammeovirga sp. SubArs3 TaxID=2995316 RepID=UPI00248AC123|nr:TlpA disulfide reductase family protein [Flammeovirga sp. SubArs3]